MERRSLSVELTEAIGLSIGKTGLEKGVYAQECSLLTRHLATKMFLAEVLLSVTK